MAIEAAIIKNMHRAIDQRDFDQIERAKKALGYLEEQKRDHGFVDYPAPANLSALRDLTYHPSRAEIIINGKPVPLSQQENKVLGYLATVRETQQFSSANDLVANCWDSVVDKSNVGIIAKKIREKIEIDPMRPQHLISVKRRGYGLFGISVEPANPPSLD